VIRGVIIEKQKRQASAAFLGVLAFAINVVLVCCILTTNFEPRAAASATGKRKRQHLLGIFAFRSTKTASPSSPQKQFVSAPGESLAALIEGIGG
jgi:hypothetical protein